MTEVSYNGVDYLVKYRHERPKIEGIILPKAGRTVAYIIDKEDNILCEAFADCSKKDCYNKAIGRKIAEGRLIKKIKSK